jgi:hypothetical protein
MKVVCINDKKQPEGGELVEGKEYKIEETFVNNFDQRVYIVAGINNHGTTKMGLRWYGYDATRFTDADNVYEEATEYNYALN